MALHQSKRLTRLYALGVDEISYVLHAAYCQIDLASANNTERADEVYQVYASDCQKLACDKASALLAA